VPPIPHAVDVDHVGSTIGTEHPAVLFNDRVTQSDFLRGGKNCSYFAVAPLEVSRTKLTQQLEQLRAQVSVVHCCLLIASSTKLTQQLGQLRDQVLGTALGCAH